MQWWQDKGFNDLMLKGCDRLPCIWIPSLLKFPHRGFLETPPAPLLSLTTLFFLEDRCCCFFFFFLICTEGRGKQKVPTDFETFFKSCNLTLRAICVKGREGI